MTKRTDRTRSARAIRPALLALTALAAGPALAQLPFSPFEARSVAMGGASVALASPDVSFLDNPASSPDARLGSVLSIGGVANESGDFLDPLRDLSRTDLAVLAAGTDPAAAANVLARLATASGTGNGILGTGRVGIAAVSQGWGIAVADLSWAGVLVRPDLVHVQPGTDPATSWSANASRAAFRGLTLRDYAVSKAYSLTSHVVVGVTGHVLRGTTYAKEESVFATDVSDPYKLGRRALTGVERTRTRFTFDAGAIISLGPVRFGGVLKGINGVSFPFSDGAPPGDAGTEVRYGRQARIGASARIPVVGIQAAVDLDIGKSDTLVPGLKSRVLCGGVEAHLGFFAVRGGLSVDLESPDRAKVLSGGVGVSVKVVRADAAVVYRPGKSALGAVLSLRAGI